MREDKKLLHAVEQRAGTDQDVSYNVSLCLPFGNKEQQQLLQFVGFFLMLREPRTLTENIIVRSRTHGGLGQAVGFPLGFVQTLQQASAWK